MITDSLEQEKILLEKLENAKDETMLDGETRKIMQCPICKKGNINISRRFVYYKETNDTIKYFNFFCDSCKTKFYDSKIRREIYFKEGTTETLSIATPFGHIQAKRNGKPIPMSVKINGERYKNVYIPIGIIDIDVTNCEIGDQITCGFDSNTIYRDDSDERSVLCIAENEKYTLGICFFETDFYYSDYCYEYYSNDKKGAIYNMIKSPLSNKDTAKNFQYNHIICATAWVENKDFESFEGWSRFPETALFLALTDIVN